MNTRTLYYTYREVRRELEGNTPFEQFGRTLDDFHGNGHWDIAIQCSENGVGVMSYSEVSARDPIFYRWHAHIEDIAQQFRDTKPL